MRQLRNIGWAAHGRAALGWAALLAGAALTGCAAGPNYHAPKNDLPPQFAAPVAAPGSDGVSPIAPEVDIAAWWRALNDEELNSLVERAVKSNLDLQMALDRLQQARTYEAVVVGTELPVVNASAAAGRGTGSDLSKGRADQILRSADTGSGLQHINTLAGFDAVWELDIFGKFRREIEAARDDEQAARAARNEVLTAVVADVVRAYVDLRGFQVRAGVLHKASEVLSESLRIVNIRYQRGITNELDVALAIRELATLQAQIAPMESQVNAAEYTLAVLVGEYPETMIQELSKADVVPSMPAPSAPGLPLEVLQRRPDVQRAERELAGATARIGVATANLFPKVTLSGSIGSQGQGWGETPAIGQHIWSFGPGAMWPILDFGALDAQVDIAGIAAHSTLMNYKKTLLTAVEQVDTALDAYQAEQARMDQLGTAMMAGQQAVDLANARYDRGLTDFLNVVDAERQFYDLQIQYADAQVTQGEKFVLLYKSLGGGWQNYQALPDIRRPQPAIIAAFRRALSANN
ncbi:MAG: outer membrane protein multidrug efflux system [Gammaproteobacteria bacterium]|jgi:NodT family efflux transporter outer membrane factor (OMF) lipoprotein|nr:outer membrane protein multidrug efflux system [Gammaproteobacteria bacterium]